MVLIVVMMQQRRREYRSRRWRRPRWTQVGAAAAIAVLMLATFAVVVWRLAGTMDARLLRGRAVAVQGQASPSATFDPGPADGAPIEPGPAGPATGSVATPWATVPAPSGTDAGTPTSGADAASITAAGEPTGGSGRPATGAGRSSSAKPVTSSGRPRAVAGPRSTAATHQAVTVHQTVTAHQTVTVHPTGVPPSTSAAGTTSVPPSTSAPRTTSAAPPAAGPLGSGRIQFNRTYTGQGTFYGATGGGNCLFPAGGDLMVAAMNHADYDGSRACGDYVDVTGPNGATVSVRIVDQCPECQPGDLDLSAQAFARLGNPSAGRIPISWKLASPPLGGPLAYVYKSGSSQWWCGIQIRNHRNPVSTVEAQVGGSWLQLARQDYNYFVSANGAGCGGDLRVTDIYGNQVTDSGIRILPDAVQQGHAQFGPPR